MQIDSVAFLLPQNPWPHGPLSHSIIRALRAECSSVQDFRRKDFAGPSLPPDYDRYDVALVFLGDWLTPAHLEQLARKSPRLVLWNPEDPYEFDRYPPLVPYFQAIFTIEESCVSTYQQLGCRSVFHLPLGVDPSEFHPMESVDGEYISDICFVGRGFPSRREWLSALRGGLGSWRVRIVGDWWDGFEFGTWMHTPTVVGPEEAARYYAGAKVVLDLHRPQNFSAINSRNLPALSPNNRLFDMAATGACIVSDFRPGIARHYVPDHEIALVHGPDGMLERIHHFLAHPHQRQTMGALARERTLREHTYCHRIRTMLDALQRSL